jgi:hypothetical protein
LHTGWLKPDNEDHAAAIDLNSIINYYIGRSKEGKKNQCWAGTWFGGLELQVLVLILDQLTPLDAKFFKDLPPSLT